MFLELVDHLRCPQPHDETWLVAATSTVRKRHIVVGVLGCPTCRTRYPVRGGTVVFSDAAAIDRPARVSSDATRIAALLGLDDDSGVVMLGRSYAHVARALHDLSGVQIFQLDPPDDVPMCEGLSGIAGAAGIPLASHVLRGAAIDDAAHVESAVRALKPKGRLVAPISVPLAGQLAELARDEMEWVAEARVPTPVIPLRRG